MSSIRNQTPAHSQFVPLCTAQFTKFFVAIAVAFASAFVSATAQQSEQSSQPRASQTQTTTQAIQSTAGATPALVQTLALTGNESVTGHTPAYTPVQVDMNALRKCIGYPVKALAKKIEGRFDVVIYINEQGEATNINFESASLPKDDETTELIAATLNGVKRCKFTPATRNTVPVSSAVKIPFRFML